MKIIANVILFLFFVSIAGLIILIALISMNPARFEELKQLLTIFLVSGAVSYAIFYEIMFIHAGLEENKNKLLWLATIRWIGVGPFVYYFKVFRKPHNTQDTT